MKRYLKESDLPKIIDRRLRKQCLDALKNGELVPYGVVWVSFRKPTARDIAVGKELIKKYKLNESS